MHKTYFFPYILSFFIYFNTKEVMIGKKNESNFKKVGSISCGFNTMGTEYYMFKG